MLTMFFVLDFSWVTSFAFWSDIQTDFLCSTLLFTVSVLFFFSSFTLRECWLNVKDDETDLHDAVVTVAVFIYMIVSEYMYDVNNSSVL